MSSVVQGNKIIDKINERLKRGEQFFSFEYFPPKTQQGVQNLDKRMTEMAERGPVWMDMTWGAGGRTSDLTLTLCDKIQNEKKIDALMHLTCTNMETKKIDDALAECKKLGVRNILALRGDPPMGEDRWTATEGGFTCAKDLITYIRKNHGEHFCVSCAGYPEGHPNVRKEIKDPNWNPEKNEPAYWAVRKLPNGKYEGVSPEDWKAEQAYLKAKVDAGSDFIVTQLFYDLDIFYAWVKECRKIGINVPILPGIMPFFKAGSFGRMTGFCKTVVPAEIHAAVKKYKKDDKAFQAWGVEYITKLCKSLLTSGIVPSVHLYTLNNKAIPYKILDALGFPKSKSDAGQLDRFFSLAIGSKAPDKGWRAGLESKESKNGLVKPDMKSLVDQAKKLTKAQTKESGAISVHTKVVSAIKKRPELSNASSHLERAEKETERATVAAYKASKSTA
mmetsp:Transcript_14408/g.20123  ORF Transcript_14408/g.20123 Transcript_14408/m.20123 type:complete len:447 (-) Transcript_14408:118-1458(-)|eukprot:CAMPEP_0184479702 /NCGR_PEP_ID=MMETSP0113_2-20130426/1319_1 /TAXON_ID=91329 /ORGANISM="Norrisiella sphaerica, Strain BC52" /LENGTH=446 /DNA_ID=CAMNT_0026857833 /DNA_START=53 /DNA_END=1393 /DNA_ORIENTATION=-